MRNLESSPWVSCPQHDPRARLKLFCFPYAGGSAAIYKSWPKYLPSFVQVCPVNLPGRGARINEQPFTDLLTLARAVAKGLESHFQTRFALFGHSMGAMISFELSRLLAREHGIEPVCLFVSGCRGPQSLRDHEVIYDLPEPEFVEELRRLKGTPQEVLEHAELMRIMIPMLRADFQVCQTYQYLQAPALGCPITVYGGVEDDYVRVEHLEQWGQETTGPFSLRVLPGDHFFLHQSEPLLLQTLSEGLINVADRSANER